MFRDATSDGSDDPGMWRRDDRRRLGDDAFVAGPDDDTVIAPAPRGWSDSEQYDTDDDHIDSDDGITDDREPFIDRRPAGIGPGGRMLGIVMVVALLGAVAVGAWEYLNTERDTVPPPLGWSTLVATERVTGDLSLLDPELATLSTTNHGTGISAVLDGGGATAIVQPSSLIVDPFSPNPTIVPITTGASVRPAPTPGTMSLLIGNDAGSNLIIVSAASGAPTTITDVAALTDEADPRYLPSGVRHDRTGSIFAIADATNFQTVVVTPGTTTPVYLPDLPLAAHPTLIVTSQTVGDRAELGLFDPDGNRIRTLSVPAVRGGTISASGSRVVVVTRDGRVIEARPDSSSTEELASLEIPEGDTVLAVEPVLGGSRLWVVSERSIFLIATDGDILGRWAATTPIEDEPVTITSRCAVAHIDGTTRLIDLDSGRELAEIGDVSGLTSSDDGCLLTGVRRDADNEHVLIGRFGTIGLAGRRALGLAPDATAAVLSSDDGPVLVDTAAFAEATQSGGPEPAAATPNAIGLPADLFTFVSD
ncbi:MAG: hypothetical protein ACO35E_06320 [Ilumatobacteraceae bacterium]